MSCRWIIQFLLCGTLTFFGFAPRAATLESQKLAGEIMIIDVHYHINWWVSPTEVMAQMKRNNIGWLGAVGPTAGNATQTGPLDLRGPCLGPGGRRSQGIHGLRCPLR